MRHSKDLKKKLGASNSSLGLHVDKGPNFIIVYFHFFFETSGPKWATFTIQYEESGDYEGILVRKDSLAHLGLNRIIILNLNLNDSSFVHRLLK